TGEAAVRVATEAERTSVAGIAVCAACPTRAGAAGATGTTGATVTESAETTVAAGTAGTTRSRTARARSVVVATARAVHDEAAEPAIRAGAAREGCPTVTGGGRDRLVRGLV